MKMSSCRSGLEGSPVAQHRPQDVDPPTSESDESLDVSFAFGPLAIVEGPGLRRSAQAGECRLVEDVLQCLVPSPHSSIVAGPFAGVVGGGNETRVGGEMVGALEGREVSGRDQELGSEGYSHPWQASEDVSLLSGEKTLPQLLVEGLDALLESERLTSEFGDDAGGELLGRQGDALGFGRGEGLLGESVGSLDAAVSEEGAEALTSRPSDLGRSLVVRDKGKSTPTVEVQSPLQGRERGQKRLSEAGDGPAPVGDEVSAAGEEDLQLSELSLASGELPEVGPHAGLVGDDVGVASIGFGLPTVGVARAVHGEPGYVEDPLLSLPKQSQKQSRTTSGLIDGPDDLIGEGEGFVDELGEVGLVVTNLSGEQLFSRSVEHVSPVGLFAGIDPDP